MGSTVFFITKRGSAATIINANQLDRFSNIQLLKIMYDIGPYHVAQQFAFSFTR